MLKRLLPYTLVAVLAMLLTTMFHPLERIQAFAQAGCQTFPETGKSVCGRFLQYWQTNGGLAQQGYPISPEFTETSPLDGKSYTVQYFERAVFEMHPENQPPNDVLLSQLGTFRYKELYPNGAPVASVPTPNGSPVASVPTPNPAGQTFSGTGVYDDYGRVTLTAGTAHFHISNASGALQVNLLDASQQPVASVVQLAGAGQDDIDVAIPAGGSYLLHIQHVGTGDWSVSVKQ